MGSVYLFTLVLLRENREKDKILKLWVIKIGHKRILSFQFTNKPSKIIAAKWVKNQKNPAKIKV